jgi:hypothetical protein
VPLEGLMVALLLGLAMEPRGLRLGPVDDRGADVGLEAEVEVDHPEFVSVAPGTPGVALAGAEVPMLLGLEPEPAGLVFQDVEGLGLGYPDELPRGPGPGLLGLCDLGRLLEGRCPRTGAPRRPEWRGRFPVSTVSWAFPIEVPVTSASSWASSILRASTVSP